MTRALRSLACAGVLLATHASASAQVTSAAPLPEAPLPPATPAPETSAPPIGEPPANTPAQTQPPEAGAAACLPACRSGFACVAGQCVSACNPPCAGDQTCTTSGECALPQPAAPPLRFFADTPATPIARDPSAQRHDGLMLRGTLGFGGLTETLNAADSAAGEDRHTRLSGLAESLSFDAGGAVARNTMLHARLAAIIAGDVHAHIDGTSYAQSPHSYASAYLLAPAVSYYFMPANVYLTGAVGLTWIALRYQNSFGERRSLVGGTGPGVNLDVGKEWWAADQAGVGVAARFWYSRISDDTASLGHLQYQLIGGALLMSVTYQ